MDGSQALLDSPCQEIPYLSCICQERLNICGNMTPQMKDSTRGERLRELRDAKGLTQHAVADHFGIDKASVSEWERDLSAPSRKRLAGLDDLYGASGEVLALYGVKPTIEAAPLDMVEALLERVDRLALQVEQLRADVVRLESRDAQRSR